MPPTKRWKSVEREVADFFSSRRTPLSGSNSGHETNSDTLSPYFYVETKYRQKHAAAALYFATLPKSRKEGKPLIIALKQHQMRNPAWLMVIDPRDLHLISGLVRRARKEAKCQRKQKNQPDRPRKTKSKKTFTFFTEDQSE